MERECDAARGADETLLLERDAAWAECIKLHTDLHREQDSKVATNEDVRRLSEELLDA